MHKILFFNLNKEPPKTRFPELSACLSAMNRPLGEYIVSTGTLYLEVDSPEIQGPVIHIRIKWNLLHGNSES